MNPLTQHYFEANRLRWNALARAHQASQLYDVEAFKRGATSLKTPELELTGPVTGKSLLHLQCHFGQDTLSWARMGAIATGMDISDEAIGLARDLSTQMGLDAEFVCCNVYDLPTHLEGQFDIVFTSYGALPWLPDLNAWADVIDRFLKPGGALVVVEFHPAWQMFNWHNLAVEYSYFGTANPYEELAENSYATGVEVGALKEYFWNHSLEEVLTPLLAKGLLLKSFKEYDWSSWNSFPNLVEEPKGEFRIKGKEGLFPLMYGLRMEKPR